MQASGDAAALERVQEVIDNAQEQLLRAKGQVARLQSGPTPNLSLSKAVRILLEALVIQKTLVWDRPYLPLQCLSENSPMHASDKTINMA